MHAIALVTALLLVGQAEGPEPTSTSKTPDKGQKEVVSTNTTPQPVRETSTSNTPQEIWESYTGNTKRGAVGGVPTMSGGAAAAAQSGVVAADVIAEAAQIIGQIVADRASAAAFALVRGKLQTLLGCPEATVGASSPAAGRFPFTCQTVAPLRIQDVAASRAALEGALFKDAVALALARLPSDDAAAMWISRATRAAFVPVLGRPGAQWTAAMADAAAQEIVAYAMNELKPVSGDLAGLQDDGRKKAVVLAGLALAKCRLDAAASTARPTQLSACAILDVYDALALKAALPAAYFTPGHVIASDLLFAAAGKADAAGGTGGSVIRARLSHGLDALVTSACVLHNGAVGCYPDPQGGDETTQVFLLVRRAAGAVIDRDSNALVVAALDGVMLAQKSADPDLRRGLQLVAATLQYADTYVVPGVDPKDAHAQRVKLLESITQEMTDRTGREEDGIWSFGGALRGVGGVRVGSGTAFYGPLALPIGFGYQGPTKKGAGFHFDVGVVDLGQYVSFDESFQVAQPKVEDLLAPSVTFAAYWGKSFPVTVGLTLGYSPHYQFTPEGDRGSFNAGVSIGVYVPLVDLN